MLNILSIPQPFVAKTGLNLLIYVVTGLKREHSILKIGPKKPSIRTGYFSLCLCKHIEAILSLKIYMYMFYLRQLV